MRAPVRPLRTMRLTSPAAHRGFSSTAVRFARRARIIDESTLAGAQHRPSLSGPSLGHLIAELSPTRPGMEGLRQEGQTMSEEHRTIARNVAKWIVGAPLAFGTAVVGYGWFTKGKEDG